MTAKTVRVLVVDDSPLSRELICDQLRTASGIEVVGAAPDGKTALRNIEECCPDIVTLDVQMPGLDGFEVLEQMLRKHPVPVIMVSSFTARGAHTTLQALEQGAMDYVPKPSNAREAATDFRKELVGKIRAMAGADVRQVLRIRQDRKLRQTRSAEVRSHAHVPDFPCGFESCCIAIGISTGGPPALTALFSALQPPLPPIVIVQHMPPTFTGPFAQRLDTLSSITVKEASGGDTLRPNHALVAPGGRHLRLRRRGSSVISSLDDGELVSGHRPSVDVMMTDVAAAFGSRCLGVIMTGMGQDGAAGCAAIRKAGGFVLGQDEASSDVYGMNKVAFVNGHVNRQFSLDALPQMLHDHARASFVRGAVC